MGATLSEKRGYQLLIGNIAVLTFYYFILDFVFRTYAITSYQAMFWGWGGAMALATPFFLAQKKSRQNIVTEIKDRKWLIVASGLITSLATGLFLAVLHMSTSGPIALLENVQIIFAVFLGGIFLGERLATKEIVASFIMLGGVFVISNLKGEVPPLAALLISGSSLCYALQSFIFKKYGKDANVYTFSLLRGWSTTLMIAIEVFTLGEFEMVPLIVAGYLAGAYIIASLISRFMFFGAHKILSVSKINIFQLFQPVGVLVGSFLIFHDPVSFQKILGAVLILIGMFFLVWKKRKVVPLLGEQ